MIGLSPTLTYGLIAVGVLVLLGLLTLAARRDRPAPAGGADEVLVRHSPAFRVFAFLAALGFPLGLAVLFTVFPPRRGESRFVLVGFAVVVGVTVALYWEAARYFVYGHRNGVECRSPWRGARYFAWDDIRDVTFNPAAGWFTFEAFDGDRIRVHASAVGVGELLRLVEAHVAAGVLQRARPGWERVGRQLAQPWDEPTLEARRPWRRGDG